MSLNVVVATTGRDTLGRLLHSIIPDLDETDFITLLVDGPIRQPYVHSTVDSVLSRYPKKVQIITRVTDKNLGYWGHAIRNKFKGEFDGDFICHADDDDYYVNNGVAQIKSHMAVDSLFLFRFIKYANNTIYKYWAKQGVFRDNVGTPCGVYPNIPAIVPDFGLFYGGDGEFYEKLSNRLDTKWIDKVIYKAL